MFTIKSSTYTNHKLTIKIIKTNIILYQQILYNIAQSQREPRWVMPARSEFLSRWIRTSTHGLFFLWSIVVPSIVIVMGYIYSWWMNSLFSTMMMNAQNVTRFFVTSNSSKKENPRSTPAVMVGSRIARAECEREWFGNYGTNSGGSFGDGSVCDCPHE